MRRRRRFGKPGDTHLIPLVDYWRERLTRPACTVPVDRPRHRRASSATSRRVGGWRSSGPRRRTGSCRSSRATRVFNCSSTLASASTGGCSAERRGGAGCRSARIAPAGRGSRCLTRRTPDRAPGIEEYLADAGFRFFFADAHMARAGSPLGLYGQVVANELEHVASPDARWEATRTPYRAIA